MPGETHIKLHSDKFFCHQASCRVVTKWFCQCDLATTVCIEGVHNGWVVIALFVILWLLRIRSKSTRSIEVHVIASVRSPSCSAERGVVLEAVPPSPGVTTVKSHDHLLAVSHQRLIMSGDVETNPGPLDQGRCGLLYWCASQIQPALSIITEVERLLSTVDDTTFGKCMNNKKRELLIAVIHSLYRHFLAVIMTWERCLATILIK